MQAQGISLITSGTSGQSRMKSTKASDSTFDSFMDTHAAKAEFVSDRSSYCVSSNKTENNTGQTDTMGTKPSEDQICVLTENKSDCTVDVLDITGMLEQTMELLQSIFQMTSQELQDVMNQAGIQTQDLLFASQDGNISMVNSEAIQQLIMEVHGVSNPTAFLTNDMLSSELNQVKEGVMDILEDGFGVPAGNLEDINQKLSPDFMETLADTLKEKMPDEMKNASAMTQVNHLSEDSAGTDKMNVQDDNSMSVVVEQSADASTESSGQNADQSSDSDTSTQTQTVDDVQTGNANTANDTAAGLFTDQLVQAFDRTETTQSMPKEVGMTQIVEQVVRQVRIRVLPETTSMELQLNPASLGRVNLTVSSTNGIATANLVVENQIAKEALESQLITLKETFDEQGIKVDAVEVTVSEFGLKKENEQEQQANQQNRNRRFKADAGAENELENDTSVITSSERRENNSVVDYTA